MSEQDETQTVLEDAMDWLLRLEANPRSAETTREFEQWLCRSDAHRDAWQQALRAWELIGDAGPVHAHLWMPSPPAHVAPPSAISGRRAFAIGTATAIAACLAIVLAGPSMLTGLQADHVTGTAERRQIALQDGSTIDLAAGSAIDTDVTETGRRVTLLSGSAYFDVAHDPKRPFVVDAGSMEVTVLGTAFNIELSSREATVELARGSVEVDYGGDGAATSAALSPGEMVSIDRDRGTIVRHRIAVEDVAAWRSGRLFVNDVTIASVIEQIQRYHGAWIGIPDRALANRRVTGLYDLSDPDRALQALVEPYGGKVRTVSAYLRIVTQY